MSHTGLIFQPHGPGLEIILSSQDDGNALTLDKLESLLKAIDQHQASFVLIHHRGPAFCAGGNLRFYQGLSSREEGIQVNRQIAQTLDQFARLKVFKMAHVDGLCLGGGLEFLSCFDKVTATPRALFGMWQRRIGLTYGWGGESRLEQRLTKGALKLWRLSTETISAYEAHRLGLVDQVVSWNQPITERIRDLKKIVEIAAETLAAHLGDKDSQGLFEELWLAPAHRRALAGFKSSGSAGSAAGPAGEGD